MTPTQAMPAATAAAGPPGRLFVFGLGYVGAALARRLRGDGWIAAGTVREPTRAQALRRAGIAAELFAPGLPLADARGLLAGTTHLLSTVPPTDDGDPVLAAHAADLPALPGLRWVGYLSSTGVYGDCGGAWVDEATVPSPLDDVSARRLRAEAAWLALHADSGVPVHVFRLAGIYGPERSALDTVRAGGTRRIVKPGQVFSRMHLDDIVATLLASMARPNPGAIYNLADDEPAPPQDVIAFACALLGRTPPPEEPFDAHTLPPAAARFYAASRRVSNRRIKDELRVRLAYPSYREGLRALAGG